MVCTKSSLNHESSLSTQKKISALSFPLPGFRPPRPGDQPGFHAHHPGSPHHLESPPLRLAVAPALPGTFGLAQGRDDDEQQEGGRDAPRPATAKPEPDATETFWLGNRPAGLRSFEPKGGQVTANIDPPRAKPVPGGWCVCGYRMQVPCCRYAKAHACRTSLAESEQQP